MRISSMRTGLVLCGLVLAGCGLGSPPTTQTSAVTTNVAPAARIRTPALVALDNTSGELEYWPVHGHGSDRPRAIASLGIFNDEAMAGDGDTVAIANYSPPEIVRYDIDTKRTTVLSDPYGSPVDVAIDKDGSIFALGSNATVAVYQNGSPQASELTCPFLNAGIGIAVDDEGDVLVDAQGPHRFLGVVAFVGKSQTCTKLHLRSQRGSLGGIEIDPKTDDLIVLDDPSLCAGGDEGRLSVYPKPYNAKSVRLRYLAGAVCPGSFVLNATSTRIFVSDTTVSGGVALIDARSYPSGRGRATYEGGNFGGFTTIPNTLPN